jgi:hypothetical protein
MSLEIQGRLQMTVFWMLCCVVMLNLTDVSDECTVHIIRNLVMVTVGLITSETSDNFYETIPRKLPEDSHLHTRRHYNLKSHYGKFSWLPSISRSIRCGTVIISRHWLMLRRVHHHLSSNYS